MSNTEYRIKTVKDFLKVPADKREQCLREFNEWLGLIDKGINGRLAELFGMKENQVLTSAFIWVDDGKTGFKEIRIVSKKRPNDVLFTLTPSE